ncbi:MAG: hypothetical protein ACYS8Z_18350 [Planctomycetota bacterium]|jgi:hypothetical protein
MFANGNKTRIETGAGQLKWVILLLVVAVVLPTVCLLWFMIQAVDNERLATRQKLINAYRDRLEAAAAKVDSVWEAKLERVESRTDADAAASFKVLAFEYGLADDRAAALVTYDESGNLLYPLARSVEGEPDLSEAFQYASQVEFIDADLQRARQLYDEIAETANDDLVLQRGIIVRLRTAGSILICRRLRYNWPHRHGLYWRIWKGATIRTIVQSFQDCFNRGCNMTEPIQGANIIFRWTAGRGYSC